MPVTCRVLALAFKLGSSDSNLRTMISGNIERDLSFGGSAVLPSVLGIVAANPVMSLKKALCCTVRVTALIHSKFVRSTNAQHLCAKGMEKA